MPSDALISAQDTWALWAILITAATLGLLAEKTNIGARISAVIITISITFVLSNLAIIPTESPVYDVVWSYFVPLAIPLLLLKANLRKIIKEAGHTLIAFTFGGIGSVIGTIIAFNIIPLGEEAWQIAAIFCATYVGGSMNFVSAAEAVQLSSGDILTAAIAADNLVMVIFFIILFSLHSIQLLRKFYPVRIKAADLPDEQFTNIIATNIDLLSLGKALAISSILCAVGFGLSDWIGIRGTGILIITAMAVVLATLFHNAMDKINGADQIGIYLMHVFFAVIGASAHVMTVIKMGPMLFVFAGTILLTHLIFLLAAGKFLKLDLAEIVIASNANLGGPTTAAAMAASRKWNHLVLPAILCGTLGYAIATFIGVGVGLWLK